MNKKVMGNYITAEAAMERVNTLVSQGYPLDSISVIASRADEDMFRDEGIAVEAGFAYTDGANDESVWQRIKAFFSGEDARLHEKDLTEYRDSIRNGNVLVLMDEDATADTLYMQDAIEADAVPNMAYASMDDDTARYEREDELDDETLRLREEQLRVNKHETQAGEVTLRKRVVEETRTIEVPVRHEEIIIERRNVTDGVEDGADFEEETISIPLMEEQIEVVKRPVVTQEIHVHKREVEEIEEVSASLRKEELEVDQDGDTVIVQDVKA